jgi:formate dehydrogenase maturation protein FdhE
MSLETHHNELKDLNRSLAAVHRSLLLFQKEIQEGLDEQRLSAYDALHASINHPDYEWLKGLTTIISSIDEQIDESEDSLVEFQKAVTQELNAMFNDAEKHPAFKHRLETAMFKNPQLCLQVAEFRKYLEKLS